jgi:hypothetical protein
MSDEKKTPQSTPPQQVPVGPPPKPPEPQNIFFRDGCEEPSKNAQKKGVLPLRK